MDDPRTAEVERIAADALDDLLERRQDPITLRFLLHHFATTARADIRDRLGDALTAALTECEGDETVDGRASWLLLFRDAVMVSDDERLTAAARRLSDSLRRDSRRSTTVAAAMHSLEAQLRSADLALDHNAVVCAAIDELEQVVARSYDPGELIGDYADHVRAAAALLSAYDVSGRLPYAMLAEELMQSVKRVPQTERAFIMECEAARVLCRLAGLHDDGTYRAAAVVAPNADYGADVSRLLEALAPRAHAEHAAMYALALSDLLAVMLLKSPDTYGY